VKIYNLWKSFMVPETRVLLAADGEDLVISSWLIHPCGRRTDKCTELRWLRRAESSNCFRA